MKRILSVLGVVLIGCSLFASLSTPSYAKVKVLAISAVAFEMPDNNTKYTNNGTLTITDTYSKYVRAPLILPNGTRITRVELICKDNSASSNVKLWLHVISNDNLTSFTLCSIESSGQSNNFRTFTTTTINPKKIDNMNYNYFLNLLLHPNNESLLAVKIYYKGKW